MEIVNTIFNTTWYINAYFAFAVPEEHAFVNVEEAQNGTRSSTHTQKNLTKVIFLQ